MHIELPDVGSEIEKGESVTGIESVKTAADVYAPSDCEVTEVNEALEDDPALVNSEPEGEGWMVKIQIKDVSDLDELLDEAAYAKLLEEEE